MLRKKGARWGISTLVFGLIALAAGPAMPAAAAPATAYSGQATVIQTTVLGTSVTLADTGPLPQEGGALNATLLTASVPGLLTANVLHAATVGQGDMGQGDSSGAEASVADLDLTVGGNHITADFLRSSAKAQCNGAKASVSGSSEIVGLTINGQSVSVTGEPNQTIALPNGKVVINEQDTSTAGSITVNALHVVVDSIANVVVSSAHADIVCHQPSCA
ncbi:MAG TPA: choice-of-anchor P family protein, partial [Chloroflexota bacterium]